MSDLRSIRDGLQMVFDAGAIDLVKPHHWAKTHGVPELTIIDLIRRIEGESLRNPVEVTPDD